MARRTVKLLHVLGSTALTGALAAYMIVLAMSDVKSLEDYTVVRGMLVSISKWVILPSLVLVLTSGLFTLVVHHPFQEARWVWIKLLLGLPMFEGTLLVVDSRAQHALTATRAAEKGELDRAVLEELVRGEWWGLWAILGLALVNIAISVYRPRLRRRSAGAK